jgi:hypothetical protein
VPPSPPPSAPPSAPPSPPPSVPASVPPSSATSKGQPKHGSGGAQEGSDGPDGSTVGSGLRSGRADGSPGSVVGSTFRKVMVSTGLPFRSESPQHTGLPSITRVESVIPLSSCWLTTRTPSSRLSSRSSRRLITSITYSSGSKIRGVSCLIRLPPSSRIEWRTLRCEAVLTGLRSIPRLLCPAHLPRPGAAVRYVAIRITPRTGRPGMGSRRAPDVGPPGITG